MHRNNITCCNQSPKPRIIVYITYILLSISYFFYTQITSETPNTTCITENLDEEQIENVVNDYLVKELLKGFEDDSLKARTLQNQSQPIQVNNQNDLLLDTTPKHLTTYNPLSASLNTLKSLLPFKNDINLGKNSLNGIYVQFLAKKKWGLGENTTIETEHLYRYGSTQQSSSQTRLNFNRKLEDHAFLSNQFFLNKNQHQDKYYWSNRISQQLDLINNQRLTYGIYSKGFYDQEKKDWELQVWGPYLSWRRPLWRDWLFIDNNMSYHFDNLGSNQQHKHNFSTIVKLEAYF